VIVIVVSNVERQIALDSLDRAWPDQAAGPAGPHALVDRVQRQMLHQVLSNILRNALQAVADRTTVGAAIVFS